MPSPGERYLISQIAQKEQIIADLINENTQLADQKERLEEVLTIKQREKLGLA